MLHYYRFYFACFCAFLATPVICKETFYKLASKDSSGAPVTDDNVPFLTQSFFTCGSNDDCTKIAKVKENSEEVIGQQKVKEGAVVYEKVNTPNQGVTWSAWNVGGCSAKCGGGIRTFTRYCYSHLPCLGKGSKARKCNTEGCPDLKKCNYYKTIYTDSGAIVNDGSLAGNSWYPLLDLKPTCHGGRGDALTSVKLQVNGTNIQYNYSCCEFKDPVCSMTYNLTAWKFGGGGSASFLDVNQIDCGTFGFIASYQLETSVEEMRYSYTCCELFDSRWRSRVQCADKTTPFVSLAVQPLFTLAQMPVHCDAGFGLASLSLIKNALLTQWRFEFRCCKVSY